eukprot:TRINITY_DN3021_c0_g1_i5.p1 TRINITY_DN3021_c0_g1~~TRINITY_DN3021_c0_g1_i5.p1  ORF type:complete len:527 (-),score=123.01 TRINITY_DN3021_c0_g1_i5:584-2131(-)
MGRRFLTREAAAKENADKGGEIQQIKQNHSKRIKKKKKKGRNKENSKDQQPFPRQKDGFTSLTILPPPGEGIVPGTDRDRPISLGHLIGRVKVGTSYLYGFREDKRNIVKTMYPISYNFYSSYGPTYDSTFSSLTLEETQLVQTGDRFSTPHSKQFADLIKNVCREDYSHEFVDRLIDILEGHDNTVDTAAITNSNHPAGVDDASRPQENGSANSVDPHHDHLIDFDALKSLNEEGIDMSFIDTLKEEFEAKEAERDSNRTLEERLDRTAVLLNNLKASQTNRLNVCPNFNLNQVEQPSNFEVKLASKVLDNLSTILKSTQPGDLVEVTSLRKAMGVNLPAAERNDSSLAAPGAPAPESAAQSSQSQDSTSQELLAATNADASKMSTDTATIPTTANSSTAKVPTAKVSNDEAKDKPDSIDTETKDVEMSSSITTATEPQQQQKQDTKSCDSSNENDGNSLQGQNVATAAATTQEVVAMETETSGGNVTDADNSATMCATSSTPAITENEITVQN